MITTFTVTLSSKDIKHIERRAAWLAKRIDTYDRQGDPSFDIHERNILLKILKAAPKATTYVTTNLDNRV